jgi:mono/diheme cytochrome c family protein
MKAGLHRHFPGLALVVAACAALSVSPAVQAQNADRGELLYETYCTGCHGSVVHLRERRAGTFNEITGQVARWQASLGLTWTAPEIADVARYLDRKFYKLSRAVSGASGTNQQPHY